MCYHVIAKLRNETAVQRNHEQLKAHAGVVLPSMLLVRYSYLNYSAATLTRFLIVTLCMLKISPYDRIEPPIDH
jgi:hypothetical protein